MRRDSILLEYSILWKLLDFGPDLGVQNLIIIDSADCLVIKVVWSYFTI